MSHCALHETLFVGLSVFSICIYFTFLAWRLWAGLRTSVFGALSLIMRARIGSRCVSGSLANATNFMKTAAKTHFAYLRSERLNSSCATELMEQRRTQLLRTWLNYGTPCVALCLALLVFHVVDDCDFGYADRVPRYANNGWFESLVCISLSLACATKEQHPQRPLRMGVQLIVSFKLILSAFAYKSCLQIVVARTTLAYIRMLMVLFFGDAFFACFCQAGISIAYCIWYQRLSLLDDNAIELLGGAHAQLFTITECGVFLCVSTIGFMFQSNLFEEANATVEAKYSSSVSRAAKSVLSSICDVVLELDSRMCIADSAQSLSLMLTGGSRQSLQACEIRDFLVDEADFEKFQASARAFEGRANDGEFQVIPFHSRMRDEVGNSIEVEVFQCPFRHHLANMDHYIVGLREFTDFSKQGRLQCGSSDARLQGHMATKSGILRSTTLGRGTPGQSQKEQLDSHSSVSHHSTEVQCRLAVQGFRETPLEMLQHTLLEGMACWNTQLPRIHCCVFHAYMKNARIVLKNLASQNCQTWTPHTKWQCPRCGLTNASPESACFGDDMCLWCVDAAFGDDVLRQSALDDVQRASHFAL